jgi:hypothetical protein
MIPCHSIAQQSIVYDRAVQHRMQYDDVLAHGGSEEVDVVDLSGCVTLVALKHPSGSVCILRAHLERTQVHV